MVAKHIQARRFASRDFFRGLGNFAELEERISALPTAQERGDAFEVFAEAYLATQKIVQAEEVWPFGSIPTSVSRKLGLDTPRDLGVDGVFKELGGVVNAYQVKFRTGRPSLTWDELSTFMGLTDQVHTRVLFTNCDDLPPVMNDRTCFFCIRGTDLDRLTTEDLAAINEWLQTGRFTIERKTPLPHQEEALTAMQAGLTGNASATAIMACGTGKTLIALWLAERMGCRRILVLVPSLALVRQTLHEWLKETRWDAPRFMCVCSDPSVTKGVDELVVQQSDLDFPVTTDSKAARAFLEEDAGDVQVVFSTYQSSQVVGEAQKGLPGFELGIFDEAHKTAGRLGTRYSFALDDRNLEIDKRVFMTATPRHYDVRRKDKEGDARLVYSMDVPEIYGPTVHTLSFAEAARGDIICDYKLIISVVTSHMVTDELLRRGEVIVVGDVVGARQVANQIALQKAAEKHDLRKIFTFHARVNAAREFTGGGGQSIASYLPEYSIFHVSGDMPTAQRERRMDAFKEADRGIMSNARCLTEGVDVPAVDMVAFMSPRKSKVDIVQATGRAMRKDRDNADKTIGYVLVPLFVEIAAGESVEEALERTDFGDVWDVLQAMKEQDDVLADIIRQMRVEKGRTGSFDGSRTRERIEVLGPELSVDMLRSAIATAIVERLGASWDERFGELERYKQEHGDCNVPARWSENPKLGGWVTGQRKIRDKGGLSAERMKRLDDLGFVWDLYEAAWEEMYAELVHYRQQQGDCNVPSKSSENPKLGGWASKQRTANKQGELSPKRKARLDALGFVWDRDIARWEEMFACLEKYWHEQGDCNVPSTWPENPRLGGWVSKQRSVNKQGELSPERKARLDTLGFAWDTWEEMLAKLKRYRQKHGDCNVPHAWSENPTLARWVNTQRLLQRQGKMLPERKARLDALEFNWDILESRWEKMFTELERYRQKYGDCNVPRNWLENRALGLWVGTQRRLQIQGNLSAERKARLEALGFVWDHEENSWIEMFALLKHYQQQYGNCLVTARFPEHPKLGTWVHRQRLLQKLGKLSSERKARLDALGFRWNVEDVAWEEMFAVLVCYKKKHGNCNVPSSWPESPRLAKWVIKQRYLHKKEALSSQRKARLDELGFIWNIRGAAWEEMFAELERYRHERGDCNVPYAWSENLTLGTWVHTQRQFQKNGTLAPERKARLDALGFVWEVRKRS